MLKRKWEWKEKGGKSEKDKEKTQETKLNNSWC